MRSLEKVERSGSPKGNKVLHTLLSWGRGESVVLLAVQACWKKIRFSPGRGACHPTLQPASYPEPSRSSSLALSHKSKCHSWGLRHAATCLCLYVQLCVKVFSPSLRLYLCLPLCQFPCSHFHSVVFLVLLFTFWNSVSIGWSRLRQDQHVVVQAEVQTSILLELGLKFGTDGFLFTSLIQYQARKVKRKFGFCRVSCKLSYQVSIVLVFLPKLYWHQYFILKFWIDHSLNCDLSSFGFAHILKRCTCGCNKWYSVY